MPFIKTESIPYIKKYIKGIILNGIISRPVYNKKHRKRFHESWYALFPNDLSFIYDNRKIYKK